MATDVLSVLQVCPGLGSEEGQVEGYSGPSEGHSDGGKHTLHSAVGKFHLSGLLFIFVFIIRKYFM